MRIRIAEVSGALAGASIASAAIDEAIKPIPATTVREKVSTSPANGEVPWGVVRKSPHPSLFLLF